MPRRAIGSGGPGRRRQRAHAVLPVELVMRKSTGRGPGSPRSQTCKGVSENDSTVPAATGMVGTKSTNPVTGSMPVGTTANNHRERSRRDRHRRSHLRRRWASLHDHDHQQLHRAHPTFDDGRIHATFTQTGACIGRAARGPEPSELHGSLHDLTGNARAKVVIAV